MTKEQSAIIDSLIEEFNKISRTPREKRSFNLIDMGPIQEKIAVKREWTEKYEKLKADLNAQANQEARTIADLLKLDLPELDVYKYAKENGHVDCPTIRVGHRSDWECIHVDIGYVLVTDPYGDPWKMPTNLNYRVFDSVYETIEAAMANKNFIERLRKLLMSKK